MSDLVIEVMDLWVSGMGPAEIALAVNVSENEVREAINCYKEMWT